MSAAAAMSVEPSSGAVVQLPLPAALTASVRVLVDALAALDDARAAKQAALERWAQAMRTVELAQEACALDMPVGDEAVTLRVSATHVATVKRAGRRSVAVTRSRVLAGRAA